MPQARRMPAASYWGIGIVALAGVGLVSAGLLKRTAANDPPAPPFYKPVDKSEDKAGNASPAVKPSDSHTDATVSTTGTTDSKTGDAPAPKTEEKKTIAENPISAETNPSNTPSLPPITASASKLMGHWTGTFGICRDAALDVTDTHGSAFSGVMTLQYPQGEVQIATAGDMGNDGKRVQFHETRVLRLPATKPWKLGAEAGRLVDSDTLAGKGSDGNSSYHWSFARGGSSEGAAHPDPRPVYHYPVKRPSTHQQTFNNTAPGVSGGTDELLAQMNTRELTDADLMGKSRWDLTVACNQPYAAHGYRFKVHQLADYFAGKSWYRPLSGDAEKLEKQFTVLERHNAHTIRDYINKHFPK